MKIALCLSGEPRSSMFCFPYIYESFLNLGPEYKVDVYIHSWRNFRAIDLYNPKSIKIEPNVPDQIKFRLPSPFDTFYYINHTLMHYSIGECFNLIKEPYDIYIRCRLDLMFDSKLILPPIFSDILNHKYDMFSPYVESPIKSLNRIDDQILISNFKGAQALSGYRDLLFSTNFEYFHKLVEKVKGFYAEGFLKCYLDEQDIKINHSPLSNYRLIRNSQITTNKKYFNFLDE